jgi:two-component system NarL family sensor kinase
MSEITYISDILFIFKSFYLNTFNEQMFRLKHFIFILSVYFFQSCNNDKSAFNISNDLKADSLTILLNKLRDREIDDSTKISIAEKALKRVENKNDSLEVSLLLDLALLHYEINDRNIFKDYSKLALNKSEDYKDSLGMALSNRYLGSYYLDNDINDSAYICFNRSRIIYDRLEDPSGTGKMLLNMAICQSNVKDYIGSEATAINALRYFLELNDYKFIYKTYNTLGILSNELKNYEQSIVYYKKALNYLDKADLGKYSKASLFNNLGTVYKSLENYKKAIEYYESGLKNDPLHNNGAKLHAMLLDNLAYAKLQSGDEFGLPDNFFYPLQIRDSIGDIPGQIINNIHIAQYYLGRNDSIIAKTYAVNALELAEESNNYAEMLTPLSLLSDIDRSKDGLLAAKKYIRISDSLQDAERKTRNQFARIRFRTDEIEKENKEISKQKDLFIAISAVLVMFGIFVYIIRKQQERNKELKFSRAQQEKNEEIYNLMLSQQRKLEEGRQQEKKRISQELHDGVLSKLFGTRLNLDSLNMKNDQKAIQVRSKYIDELKSIEKEIRQISHDLNTEIYDSNLGYTEVISNLIASQALLGNLEYKFQSDSDISWETISNKVKIHLYRIIQEALQNINKHANAKNIRITFKKIEETLLVSITDDGVGFDSSKIKNGIGLKNIKSRVKEIGGKLQLNSAVGGGTNININISV